MAFGTNRRSAPVMAVLSGLFTANKGGTAVNPVPFLLGIGVFLIADDAEDSII